MHTTEQKNNSTQNTVGDVNSNELGSGARNNAGKPDYSLIPLTTITAAYPNLPDAIKLTLDYITEFQMEQDSTDGEMPFKQSQLLKKAIYIMKEHLPDAAYVFEYGRKKYAAWNWAKGQKWSIPIGCIGRHAEAIGKGETNDQESNQAHAGHILCNIIMLRWFVAHYPAGNDLARLPQFQTKERNVIPVGSTGKFQKLDETE